MYTLYFLTHVWLEVNTGNFSRMDHLWPNLAGDCDYFKEFVKIFLHWYYFLLTIYDKFSFRFSQRHFCRHQSLTIRDQLTLRVALVTSYSRIKLSILRIILTSWSFKALLQYYERLFNPYYKHKLTYQKFWTYHVVSCRNQATKILERICPINLM